MNFYEKYCHYLESSLRNTPVSIPFLIFILFLEHFPILILNILLSDKIRLFFKFQENENEKTLLNSLNSILYKISLTKYYHQLLEIHTTPKGIIKLVICIIVFCLMIYFVVFIIFSETTISPASPHLKVKKNCEDFMKYTLSDFMSNITVYIFDIFIFRILFFWFIYACLNATLNHFYEQNNNYYVALIGFIVTVVYSLITLVYLKITFFYLKFTQTTSQYPYDSFSSMYDTLFALEKIFIALSANIVYLDENLASTSYGLWLWSCILTKCILLAYCCIIIFKLISDENYILFYRNFLLNTIRLGYLFCYLLSFIGGIAFHIIGYVNLLIPTYIAILMLALFILGFVVRVQNNNILFSNNLWNKLLLSLNYYLLKEQELSIEILKNIEMSHLTKCFKEEEQCPLCNNFLISSNEDKDSYIINLILFLYKSRKLFSTSENNAEEIEKKLIIKTFVKIYLSRQNTFTLNVLFIRSIPKLMKLNQILAMNFIIYFKSLLSRGISKVEQIQSILMLDHQKEKLQKFIEIYKEIIYAIDKNYEGLIHKATLLYKLKKDIKRQLRNKREDFVEYQFIIMKYIYETMLNKQLKNKNNNSVFNFSFYEDFLQYHYDNDNHFVLNYDLLKKDFEILKTGKEYANYLHKRFITIFPFTEIAFQHLNLCLENQVSTSLDFSFQQASNRNNTKSKSTQQHKHKDSKDNNNAIVFEYPAKIPTPFDFVCSFQMSLEIFPTINLKNFYIMCFYQNNYTSIILTLCDHSINKEKIVSFSPSLECYFVITPNIINELNYYGRFIYFDNMFTFGTEENDEENKNYLQFNYKKYYSLLNGLIKFYFEIESSVTETDQSKLKESVVRAYKVIKDKPNSNKLALLKVKEIFFPKNNNLSVKIYNTQINPKFRKNSIIKQNSCFYTCDTNEIAMNKTHNNTNIGVNKGSGNHEGTNNQYIHTTGYFMSHSSMTRINSSSERQTGVTGQVDLINKFKRNMKIKKNQYKRFSIITFTILIYNIILILLTIIFLIMEIRTNNIFQNSFTFLQLWNKYTRMLMSTTLTMFSTICPAKNNQNECEMVFQQYSKEYSLKSGTQDGFDVLDYLSKQMEVKIETFTPLLHTIKERIFHSRDKKIVEISEEEITYISIYNNNNTYQVTRKDLSFMTTLDIYLSVMNNIVTTKDFDSMPIQIISVRDQRAKIDLSNIHIAPGDERVLDAYAILLNYRVFMFQNTRLTQQVTQEVINDIEDCEFIGVFFLIFLIANHFVLFCICIFVIRLFRNILNKYCIETYETFDNEILINGLKEKSQYMSELLVLYKKSPNFYSKAYDKLKSTIKKSLRSPDGGEVNSNTIQQSQMTTSSNINDQTSMNENLQLKSHNNSNTLPLKPISIFRNNNNGNKIYHPFNELLNPSLILIYCIFLTYFIFAIVYFILFKETITSYKNVIAIFKDNANVDFNIYALASIMQIMLLTNQTAYEMLEASEQTPDKSGDDFITSRFKQTFNLLFTIEKAEGPHFKDITPLVQIIELNCDTYLDIVQDEFIIKIQELYDNEDSYPKIKVKENLSLLCNTYEYLSHDNDKNMINQVLYRLYDIKDRIIYTFEELYKINTSKEIFDMYLILLTVYQPIRNYESAIVYNDFIKAITHRNDVIIYSYLVINIIFEFIIFILLKKFVISKFLIVNKSMNMFTRCIEV